MSEPITVDVPPKPPASSTPAPVPGLKAADKEKARPATTSSPPVAGNGLTRKPLVIAACGLISLAASFAAVRLLWPPDSDRATTAAPTQSLAVGSKDEMVLPKTPTQPPTLETIPSPDVPVTPPKLDSDLPPVVPPTSPAPALPPPSVNVELPAPAPLIPAAPGPTPPTEAPPALPALPPLPAMPGGSSAADPFRAAPPAANPPPAPSIPPIVPAGGSELPKPPDGGLPALPTPPASEPVAPPAIPTAPPMPKVGEMPPAPPPTTPPAVIPPTPTTPAPAVPLPPVPGSGGSNPPPPADLNPKTPPPPDSGALTIPLTPKSPGEPVPGLPVTPTPPPATPPLTPTVPAPGTGPAGTGPTGSLPIPPAGPASPGSSGTAGPLPADLSGTSGTKLEFTKPPSSATVTPISGSGNSERVPTTSYDVTIYVPKATDTYESISREFYNDARYATALRTYNRNKVVQGADAIDIPPIYILKRLLQPQSGPGSATGRGGNLPPDWGTANPAAPRSSGGITFRIPQGGMSMRTVARWALGNEQRWTEIYDLNPQHTKPDAILPAGTELKLPADARPPE